MPLFMTIMTPRAPAGSEAFRQFTDELASKRGWADTIDGVTRVFRVAKPGLPLTFYDFWEADDPAAILVGLAAVGGLMEAEIHHVLSTEEIGAFLVKLMGA
jgi:hypothetical protein